MTEKKLLDFIVNELNENNKYNNVMIYDYEYFTGGKTIRIAFNRNHKTLYNRLLCFCADNDIVVIETHPGIYATCLRIEQ